jgi:hypothetical protein
VRLLIVWFIEGSFNTNTGPSGHPYAPLSPFFYRATLPGASVFSAAVGKIAEQMDLSAILPGTLIPVGVAPALIGLNKLIGHHGNLHFWL